MVQKIGRFSGVFLGRVLPLLLVLLLGLSCSDLSLLTNQLRDGGKGEQTSSWPSVTGVSVSPAVGEVLSVGGAVEITVTFAKVVQVAGGNKPSIEFDLGNTSRRAFYDKGSGTSALVFRYEVVKDDRGLVSLPPGVSIKGGNLPAEGLSLNVSSTQDAGSVVPSPRAKYISRKNGTYVILHSTRGESWRNAPDFYDPNDYGSNDVPHDVDDNSPRKPDRLPRWVPYGVGPRRQRPADQPQWPAHFIDPSNAYDIDEIAAYAKAHPGNAVKTFLTLDKLKAEALAVFNSGGWMRERFRVGVAWGGSRFPIDEDRRIRLMEFVLDIANREVGPFLFYDADDVTHQLSSAQVLSFSAAVRAELNRISKKLSEIKASIRAATSYEELKKIATDENVSVSELQE